MATELETTRIERKRVEDETGTDEIQQDTKKQKPGALVFLSMVLVAVIFDILSIVPGLNDIIIVIADTVFISWFLAVGMKFTGKRIVLFAITTLAEAVPLISIFPMITVSILVTYYLD